MNMTNENIEKTKLISSAINFEGEGYVKLTIFCFFFNNFVDDKVNNE